jgi:WD domain, G-beta repeat
VSTGDFVESRSARAPDFVQASLEGRALESKEARMGRTLDGAIDVDTLGEVNGAGSESMTSSLQKPVLLRGAAPKKAALGTVSNFGDWIRPSRTVELESAFQHLATQASVAARAFLDVRDRRVATDRQIRQIQNSIHLQLSNQASLLQQRELINQQDAPEVQILDDIAEGEQNCARVLAQLGRDLEVRLQSRERTEGEYVQTGIHRRASYEALQRFFRSYRDPLHGCGRIEPGTPFGNVLLQSLHTRERGTSLRPTRPLSLVPSAAIASTVSTQRRALLLSRMSHAATINTHLAYPIYCLRFDKTGRYFITGADDYLVRVFALGGTNQLQSRQPNPHGGAIGAVSPTLPYARGAILVCTLRGHAGVINDIDVSSDNSMLATASEDGDCRVWGLKDGCPVAILRGHVGGANMVRLCLSECWGCRYAGRL